MKIMQVIPTLNVGGAEIMLETLVNELIVDGNEVVVVVFYDSDSIIKKRLLKNKVKIIYLNKRGGFNFETLWNLWNVIKSEDPDIIHTHLHVLPYIWLVSGKIKIVHTLHSIASKEQSGLGKVICGYIYKNSSKCIPVAISELVRKSLQDEFKVTRTIPVVNNGINLRERVIKETYKLNKIIKLVHVGRLIKVKNHRLMIDAVANIINVYPNIKLHFFGSGEEEDSLKKYVLEKNLKEKVVFEGMHTNVAMELCKADIFLLPSEYEGMPMSLIEAMAAGVPAIASNVGGIPDMVQSGVNGILINPNEEELVKSIKELLENENLRYLIGSEACKSVQKFSGENMMKGYKILYDECNAKT